MGQKFQRNGDLIDDGDWPRACKKPKNDESERAGDEKSRVVSPRSYLYAERAKHGGTCLNLFDRRTTRGRRGNVAVQNSSHQLATFARPTSGLKSAEVSARRYSRGNLDSADPRSGLRSRRLEIAHPEKFMFRMFDSNCTLTTHDDLRRRNVSSIASPSRKWSPLSVPRTVTSRYLRQRVTALLGFDHDGERTEKENGTV